MDNFTFQRRNRLNKHFVITWKALLALAAGAWYARRRWAG